MKTTLGVVDPTADRAINFPNVSGTIITSGNLTDITTVGTITSGVWNGTTIAVANGGTGATSLNNLITLSTHTTGNYVASIASGNGISGSSASEGGTPTIAIDLLDSADGTGSTSSNSGLEFQGSGSNELTVLQGCANNEVLSWNDSTNVWQCAVCLVSVVSPAPAPTATLPTGTAPAPFPEKLSFLFPEAAPASVLTPSAISSTRAALPRSQLWLTWLPATSSFQAVSVSPLLGGKVNLATAVSGTLRLPMAERERPPLPQTPCSTATAPALSRSRALVRMASSFSVFPAVPLLSLP
ncbi:MAG: hypothetical protein WDN67_03280 [Candidatus Moraniibacteriota bacterium]